MHRSLGALMERLFIIAVIGWIVFPLDLYVQALTSEMGDASQNMIVFWSCCCSVTQLCLTLCDPVDCTHQDPLSMRFSRQEYWSQWTLIHCDWCSYKMRRFEHRETTPGVPGCCGKSLSQSEKQEVESWLESELFEDVFFRELKKLSFNLVIIQRGDGPILWCIRNF